VRTIVDSGPLVALLNGRDSFHGWVTQALKGLPLPLFTCEPVLAEAAYLTGKPAALLAMVVERSLKVDLDLEDQADAMRRLLARYGERMSLADACVVRMSELARRSRVFTLDRRDFSIYRRNGREMIPLLAP
jgi:predicted nucleic acid-binding protein